MNLKPEQAKKLVQLIEALIHNTRMAESARHPADIRAADDELMKGRMELQDFLCGN